MWLSDNISIRPFRTLATFACTFAVCFLLSRDAHAQEIYENVDVPVDLGMSKPHSYALIAYAEDYSIAPHVPYARRDAEAFEKYATAELGVPDDSRHVVQLKNPTFGQFAAGISRFLDLLSTDQNADRSVYVYFAGHGVADEKHNSLALLPIDYDPHDFLAYALDVNSAILDKLTAQAVHGLIILDTCFSGLAARDQTKKGILGDTRAAERPVSTTANPQLVVISAVSEGEISNPLPQTEHGLFTYFLLSGLRGKAANQKGDITIASLYDFLQAEVPAEAARNQLSRQTPRILPSMEAASTVFQNETLVSAVGLAHALKEGAYKYCLSYGVNSTIGDSLLFDKNGDSATAVQRCTDAIRSGVLSISEKAQALRHRGIAYDDLHDADSAMSDYEEALRLTPGSADTLTNLCEFYFWRYQSSSDKNLENALENCNAAIKADPKYEPAYVDRAEVYDWLTSDVGLAIADLDHALQLKRDDIAALVERADMFFEKADNYNRSLFQYGVKNLGGNDTDFTRGMQDMETAIKLAPKNAELYRSRATRQPSDDLTFADLNKAIDLNPSFVQAYLDRGERWEAKGQLAKAIEDYTHAFHVDSKCTHCLLHRAEIYESMKNKELAKADYDQLVEIDKNFLLTRGAYLLKIRDNAAAIADYSAYVEFRPGPESLVERARAYTSLNDLNSAARDYSEAIKLAPTVDNYLLRAEFFERTKDLDGAIEDYTEVIKLSPNADHYAKRAELFEKKRDYSRAVDDYGQATQLDPDRFEYYSRGGGILGDQLHDYDRAIEAYSAALKAIERRHNKHERGESWSYTSTAADLYASRAICHYDKREYDAAIADANYGLGMDDECSRCLSIVGSVHYSRHEYQEAIQAFSKAIALWKTEARFYMERGDAYRAQGDVQSAISDFRTAQKLARESDQDDEALNGELKSRLQWVEKSE